MQIVDIMLAAVSIWLEVKYFDAQVGYSEVIALFCSGCPLGFDAALQIQGLLLQFFNLIPVGGGEFFPTLKTFKVLIYKAIFY